MATAKVKRWGNSLGLVIPKIIADENNLHENDVVELEVRKRARSFGELFGTFETEKTTRKLIVEAREGERE